MTDILSKI